jgi:hypothetical protein
MSTTTLPPSLPPAPAPAPDPSLDWFFDPQTDLEMGFLGGHDLDPLVHTM